MKILSLFISLLMCGILSANTLSLESNNDGTWNADSDASGVYFVKMVAGEFVNTQKLMLVK